ncbi:MAG: siphovirus Gp157 family protein [Galactobacillus timonensis]|nr:siphovirus Gp157 family protein [Galactobacillus timonensis]
MATLYELSGEYLELLEMAEDPETDPQAFSDTLESLDWEFEDKADGYAKIIAQMSADSGAIGDEIKRLQARKKSMEGNIDRMKKSLQMAMETTGKRKFKTSLFSFGIQKNPPRVVMDAENLTDIPIDYLVPQDPTVDKKKIMAELKSGAALPFAHLEQDEGIRIR